MKSKTFYYKSYKIVYGTYENATERITGYYVLALDQIYKTLQSAESAIDNHLR
jgi:hypothetical protein